MKKLLTTAALLTLGTAASFATEFTLVGTGTSGTDYGDNYVSSGRAAFNSITLDDETSFSAGDTLYGSQYNWSISFSITGFNLVSSSGGDSATSQKTLFSLSSDEGVGTGYGVIAYADGTNIYYSLTSDARYHADGDEHNVSDYVIGNAFESAAEATVTISWSAVASTLSLSVGGTSVASTTISNADDASLRLYAGTGTVSNVATTTFWTNGGDNPIQNITLSVTAAPEPSMFGLLAGLGAIGFVAARRRRNRKA